jgi:hypothetical protein
MRLLGSGGTMRTAIPAFAASIVIVAPAEAANETVQLGPVPAWATPSPLMPVPEGATGMLFVRSNDVIVHLDAKGQAHYQGYHVKILHSNALALGNLAIAWNPAAGAPVIHSVRIHRGGEVVDVLKSASFEILRREDQLEMASLNGVLTAALRIPDLRVGDELEVAWTTRSSDPTLGPNDAGLLALAREPGPGRFMLEVNWSEGQEPRLKISPDIANAAERRPRAVKITLENPGMLIPPKDAPPRYHWQRFVEYSDFADWAAVSRHFAPLYSAAASVGASSAIKAEAKRIAADHAGPLDRASAALALVQQQVRYVYVGLNGANLKPATADETWRRRYGDCKGKTALLLALLAELGIEAEPVLVNNAGSDDGLDERLPNPGMFDHVLVRMRLDGAEHWLDGTLPHVAVPSRLPVMPYRWTLPLRSTGSTIERLAWSPPQKPGEVSLYEIDARAGFDKPARITTTSILRGIKGLEQQVQFSALTADQILNAFRQQLIGDTWQAIEDVSWRYDVKAQASVLKISGTGTVNWDDDGDGAKSLSLPGGGFNPPERRIRSAGEKQGVPYYNAPDFDCHVTTVRLPASTKLADWSFNSSFETQIFGRRYYRAFDLRDGAIRMVRGLRVEQPEIDAASALRDNGRIASFDNSMAVISYEPGKRGAGPQNVASVPATYEIDWTADDARCLPVQAAKQVAAPRSQPS